MIKVKDHTSTTLMQTKFGRSFFLSLSMLLIMGNLYAQVDTLGWSEFYAVEHECFEDPYQPSGSHFFNAGINSFGNIDIAREYKNSEELLISEVILDVFELSSWNGGVADVTIYEMEEDNGGTLEPHPIAFVTYSPLQDPDVPSATFPMVTSNHMVTVTFTNPVMVTGDFAVGINFGESELNGPANYATLFGLTEAFGINHTLRSEPAAMGGHSWLQWASFNTATGGDWTRFDDGPLLSIANSGLLEMSVDLGIFPVVENSNPTNTAEISIEQNSPLNIYPNPTSDKLILDLTDFSSGELNLEFYNLTGKLVYSKMISTTNRLSLNLNNLDLNVGMYFVKVSNNKLQKSAKVTYLK